MAYTDHPLSTNYITSINVGGVDYEIRGTMEQAIHFEGVLDTDWTETDVHTQEGNISLNSGGKTLKCPIVGCMVIGKSDKKEWVCTSIEDEGTSPEYTNRKTKWTLLGYVKESTGKIKEYTGVVTANALSSLSASTASVITSVAGTVSTDAALTGVKTTNVDYTVITADPTSDDASKITTTTANVVSSISGNDKTQITFVSEASLSGGGVSTAGITMDVVTSVSQATSGTAKAVTSATLSSGSTTSETVVKTATLSEGNAGTAEAMTNAELVGTPITAVTGINKVTTPSTSAPFVNSITFTSATSHTGKVVTGITENTGKIGRGTITTHVGYTDPVMGSDTVKGYTGMTAGVANGLDVLTDIKLTTPSSSIVSASKQTSAESFSSASGSVITAVTGGDASDGTITTAVTLPTINTKGEDIVRNVALSTDVRTDNVIVSMTVTTSHSLIVSSGTISVPTALNVTSGTVTGFSTFVEGGVGTGKVITAVTPITAPAGTIITAASYTPAIFETVEAVKADGFAFPSIGTRSTAGAVKKSDFTFPIYSFEDKSFVTGIATPGSVSNETGEIVTNISAGLYTPQTGTIVTSITHATLTSGTASAITTLGDGTASVDTATALPGNTTISATTTTFVKADGFAFPTLTTEEASVIKSVTQGTLTLTSADFVNSVGTVTGNKVQNVGVVTGVEYTDPTLSTQSGTLTAVTGVGNSLTQVTVIGSHSTFKAITGIPRAAKSVATGVEVTGTVTPLTGLTYGTGSVVGTLNPGASIAVVTEVTTQDTTVVTAIQN